MCAPPVSLKGFSLVPCPATGGAPRGAAAPTPTERLGTATGDSISPLQASSIVLTRTFGSGGRANASGPAAVGPYVPCGQGGRKDKSEAAIGLGWGMSNTPA